jgi:hypothetical protein
MWKVSRLSAHVRCLTTDVSLLRVDASSLTAIECWLRGVVKEATRDRERCDGGRLLPDRVRFVLRGSMKGANDAWKRSALPFETADGVVLRCDRDRLRLHRTCERANRGRKPADGPWMVA